MNLSGTITAERYPIIRVHDTIVFGLDEALVAKTLWTAKNLDASLQTTSLKDLAINDTVNESSEIRGIRVRTNLQLVGGTSETADEVFAQLLEFGYVSVLSGASEVAQIPLADVVGYRKEYDGAEWITVAKDDLTNGYLLLEAPIKIPSGGDVKITVVPPPHIKTAASSTTFVGNTAGRTNNFYMKVELAVFTNK